MMDGEEKENNKMEKEIILMEEDGNEKEDEECKFMEQIQEKILGRLVKKLAIFLNNFFH
jgi:hypothetical protein